MRVANTRPGREVELEVVRGGEPRTVEVEIGELAAGAQAGVSPSANDNLGLGLRDLDAQTAAQLGVEARAGALVSLVEPLSAGARAGLRAGDVITEVQGERVRSVAEFRRQLAEHDLERGVRLTVRTGAGQRFVLLQQDRADD